MTTQMRSELLTLFLVLLCTPMPIAHGQTRPGAPPRFEDYPANNIFTGTIAAPKLTTAVEQKYAEQIENGVEKGYGVFRDGKEQKGPNFASNLIVIQWPCGAPCLRVAIVDAQNGNVYYPPVSDWYSPAPDFALPLLAVGEAGIQNPEIEFRLDSDLMVLRATQDYLDLKRRLSFTYYFLWRQGHWTVLRKVPLDESKR
jgi:hypothetical protein